MQNLLFKTLLTLILLVAASSTPASPLFEETTVLEVSLAGPLGSLFENKDSSDALPFVLAADNQEHGIKVNVRGNSRRRVCSFPPLRLNFASKDTPQSVFEGQDKLKLVTHCRDRTSAQSSAFKEYAAYRIFNLISDISYRVRLLRIIYTDTDQRLKEKDADRYGFLIESDDAFADRVGGQAEKVTGVSLQSLDEQQAARVYVFQYLIGNTDWSLVTADTDDTCCHNGDLFEIDAARFYVPYDFDLSGLVNASYARPDATLNIARVTQRRYRGYCISSDALSAAISEIKEKRADILGVIQELPGLSEKEVKTTTRFLEKFFDRADDEDKMLRLFERRCL